MELIITLVLAFVVASLGVMQIADILVNGSIFEHLREEISYRRDLGYRLFGILNQLFTCMLCMTTQVALWVTWIPAGLITHRLTGLPVFSVVFGFVSALAIAGTALGVWMLFQYSPKRYHALKQENERLVEANEELRRAAAQRPATKKDLRELGAVLTPDVLTGFFRAMYDPCSGIGCGIMRAYCMSAILTQELTTWRNRHPIADRFPGLHGAVVDALNGYMDATRGYPANSPRHEEMMGVEHRNLLVALGARA